MPEIHLTGCPEPLRNSLIETFAQFHDVHINLDWETLDPKIKESLPKILLGSHFIFRECIKRPQLLENLILTGQLLGTISCDYYRSALSEMISSNSEEEELMRLLRSFRNEEMVRIAWRDIAGWASLEETLQNLTDLAEACVERALDVLFQSHCARRGIPKNKMGAAQNLIVLAMGKLGACELNFSSDIDLIFAFRDDGTLEDKRETSYGEFYTRLAQSLIKVLDSQTPEGFVFRVDTRLRPFGDSGPLVMSFSAMESYYQAQAREWERYAMVKGRVIAGDLEAGAALESFLVPFVFRRYLDFRTLSELRDIKSKITAQLKRKDRMDNLKLGPGGIREIEFIGQSFQLVRGGREPALRAKPIQVILKTLSDLRLMEQETVDRLITAYRFLRTVENRVQQIDDRQTHDLPLIPHAREGLAFSLGFSSWSDLDETLKEKRHFVHTVFGQTVLGSEVEICLFVPLDSSPEIIESYLIESGFCDTVAGTKILFEFLGTRKVRSASLKAADEIRRLLPKILDEVSSTSRNMVTLERILLVIEALLSRSVYLTLLNENREAVKQLIRLSDSSSWICRYLADHPVLLDELLDLRSLLIPLDKQELFSELRTRMQHLPEKDDERCLIALREFKQAHVLRVAAADLYGYLPLPKVSDYLTDLAEVMLSSCVDIAWMEMMRRYGTSSPLASTTPRGFGVIAYGKLGGYELGYGSDLDLVFIYDEEQSLCIETLSPPEFFGRLARHVIRLVTTMSPAGTLYELDLRLRPSGDSGLLVTSLTALHKYQIQNAWTWEQQALIKARVVLGDDHIRKTFHAIRIESLSRVRNPQGLLEEILSMRAKMLAAQPASPDECFNVKLDKGGIVDIEFLVQFGVLLTANRDPNVTQWTDVARLLEVLACSDFLSTREAERLREIYFLFRSESHAASLQEREPLVFDNRFEQERSEVSAIWEKVMEHPSQQIPNT